MLKPISLVLIILLQWACPCSLQASTPISLNALFSDGMVLQRDIELPVWGTAAPDVKVTVNFLKQSVTTTADSDGRWQVRLAPVEAGGPHVMTVSAASTTLTVKDVLVGDVWICSGQSNMQFTMASADGYQEELQSADYPNIRQFTVGRKPSVNKPRENPVGKWTACSPKTLKNFSAVAYFFGRELHRHLNVPIGLINTTYGGTPIEAWMSPQSLRSSDDFKPILDRYADAVKAYPQLQEEYLKLSKLQKSAFRKVDVAFADPGNEAVDDWANPKVDTADWETIDARHSMILWPGDSVVWARMAIDIPEDLGGQALVLSRTHTSRTASMTAYFNGHPIELMEQVGYMRTFNVSGELVKPGRAVIALRIYSDHRTVNFWNVQPTIGPAAEPPDRRTAAGEWRYHHSASAENHPIVFMPPPRLPMGPDHPKAPIGLFHGMIHPLIPYGIKGATWYQGEANTTRAYQYRSLLKTMIEDWRSRWKQGDFPFLIVQLANYTYPLKKPAASIWAELRESQALVAHNVEQAGLAVAIDIGEARDIHPKNKRDVGLRLALAARKIAYGESITSSGPVYHSMKIDGSTIRLQFDHVGKGLIAKGGPLKRFSIAGKDRVFHWADARIDGESILVSHPDVSKPVAVRYAWENNPEGCNLYNADGLPAVPFRTDNWPGLTDKKR